MKKHNIAMIGAGRMATILSRYFAKDGHQVYIGARELAKARQLADTIGQDVKSGTIDEAVQHGDVIFLAVPYLQIQDTLKLTGPLTGKIVVDMSNPFKPDFSGLLLGGDTSAGEDLAKRLPGSRVIKAFNSLFATVLERGPDYGEQRAQVFYAGDDETAKRSLADLINSTGFEAVDTGPLSSARFLEQLSVLVIRTDNHLKEPVQITPVMLARPSL